MKKNKKNILNLNKEIFWIYEPKILFKYINNIFFCNLNTIESLNNLSRLSILLIIIQSLISYNSKLLFLIPIILTSIIIYYYIYINKKETFENYKEIILEPTINNPLMNPTYSDYGNNKSIPIRNKNIKKEDINKYLIKENYYGPGDTISKNNFERSFIPSIELDYNISNNLYNNK